MTAAARERWTVKVASASSCLISSSEIWGGATAVPVLVSSYASGFVSMSSHAACVMVGSAPLSPLACLSVRTSSEHFGKVEIRE